MNQPAKIVVIGAGISGIRSALDLAELGYKVCLLDRAPAMGGILTRLDRQFPNNHCGICRMLPMFDRDNSEAFCLRKGLSHDNIELLLSTEVTGVEGNPGNMTVTMVRQATGVDADRCIGCRECEKICPVEVPDSFNAELGKRKAIYLEVPYQRPNQRVIDLQACTRCGECVKVCPTAAIDLDMKPEILTFENIGGIVLASGTGLFNPQDTDVYGMDHFPNVVTSSAFERILSSSGPYQGSLMRPSDQHPPRKIAWIQCVGSRNPMIGADYCSSACCMISIKQALFAKERLGSDTQTTIFYMDMRTFGRDYQRYRDQAEKENKVAFVRCRIHSIEPGDEEGNLKISYVDHSGKPVNAVFDMAVLATGKDPLRKIPDFAAHPGIIATDAVSEWMDIGSAVVSASAVSERLVRMLSSAGISPEKQAAPPLSDKVAAPPHLQVVLCSCHGSLDKVLAENQLAAELKKIPGRMDIMQVKSVCDAEGLEKVKETLESGPANRLLFAACDTQVFLPKLRQLAAQTGIPKEFMDVVNLRVLAENASSPEVLGEMMQQLEMRANRLFRKKITPTDSRPIRKTALVIGGGPAGLSAALALAAQKIKVILVEKQETIGGNFANIYDAQNREMIGQLIAEAKDQPLITIHTDTEVINNAGVAGQFAARLRDKNGAEITILHGAAVIATGGGKADLPADTRADNKIISLYDLEAELNQPGMDAANINTVVFMQCVGSREEPRNYCSRICCLKSLKTAMKLKELNPDCNISIFYRDMMTYGESEKFYTQARAKGIIFIPFEKQEKPQIKIEAGRVLVQGFDPVLNEPVCLEADRVVLASGLIPNPVDVVAQAFQVSTTRDGFIREADSKWRPVDTGREGIFVCGLARGPVRADEAVQEGKAAALRALRILARDTIAASRHSAYVRHAICSLCERCIAICPFDARFIDPDLGRIMVDPVACQGCGLCAAECPNGATLIGDFEEYGVLDEIEAALG
ncbi:MAG: FAD-dependent oxidoreductase [Proteobacteria bacterium]|nr:FAD-dependent oxidoreductase [Pseudomonadota bacterium]MBU4294379.1 FAD-dependent oxidoreductase [Pseudomonadota bacterium]MCG2749445.1 FAD-dependent oxidoreductase [Desulfobulbaceae bacterium]